MVERILIYRWGSLSEPSFIRCLKKRGTECPEFSMKMKDYHADAVFAQRFMEKLHREKPDAVFSFDYFPLVSMICEINAVPYLSWIYDCPQYTLLSKTVASPVNYIFCFDSLYAERIRACGAANVYHLPLAADVEGLAASFSEGAVEGRTGKDNISFVGNLYNGEKNRLRHVRLAEYTEGYVEGLINAQLRIYGYNFLMEAMKDSVIQELTDRCDLRLGPQYIQLPARMAADAAGMEVTAREREMAIDMLSGHFPVTVYTGSAAPERWKQKKSLSLKGCVDYEKEVPSVFHNSRINLNITSRTIESGIPQRVLDILGCCGFCMTNYQPEIAEAFADGEELSMYSGMEELLEKTAYYLEHEEERQRIAQKGMEKVKKEFALTDRIGEMLFVLEGTDSGVGKRA